MNLTESDTSGEIEVPRATQLLRELKTAHLSFRWKAWSSSLALLSVAVYSLIAAEGRGSRLFAYLLLAAGIISLVQIWANRWSEKQKRMVLLLEELVRQNNEFRRLLEKR